jgi:hypothetical protein
MLPDVSTANSSLLNTALILEGVRVTDSQHSLIMLKKSTCASETNVSFVLRIILSQIIIKY